MTFSFDQYHFDPATGRLTLRYSYDDGVSFEEVIKFSPPFGDYDGYAADRVFRLIFLLAGVSYYKARVPERLVVRAFDLDASTAGFLTRVYELGLAEFAHRNGLNLRGKIRFDSRGTTDGPVSLSLPDRVLVPVGGGKDSIVALEALRRGGFDVTLFALGGAAPAQPISDTIKVSGLASVFVSRILSPAIIEMNKNGAYNGHVPVTAILSAIALGCAVLYGFRYVVMSNEHSASVPNFDDVNHQYSKSLEFERELDAYVSTHISPDLGYFSLLRPLSEIDIARRFAMLSEYHAVFRSCNAAFRQDEAAREKKWCCNCPKCRFVFLALAPFMGRQALVDIFGRNMLDDAGQTQGFSELAGISNHKPFECVGEISESAAALRQLASMEEWRNDAVVAALAPKLGDTDFDALFCPSDDHAVPEEFLRVLK